MRVPIEDKLSIYSSTHGSCAASPLIKDVVVEMVDGKRFHDDTPMRG